MWDVWHGFCCKFPTVNKIWKSVNICQSYERMYSGIVCETRHNISLHVCCGRLSAGPKIAGREIAGHENPGWETEGMKQLPAQELCLTASIIDTLQFAIVSSLFTTHWRRCSNNPILHIPVFLITVNCCHPLGLNCFYRPYANRTLQLAVISSLLHNALRLV